MKNKLSVISLSFSAIFFSTMGKLQAQVGRVKDAQAGVSKALDESNNVVGSVVTSALNLLMGIGAILAIVGAGMVYSKLNSGDREGAKALVNWILAGLFLVAVPFLIKTMFL